MCVWPAYLVRFSIVDSGLVEFAIRGNTREQTSEALSDCRELARERAALDVAVRAIANHPNAQLLTGRNRASVAVAVLAGEVKLSDQHVVLS
jgi:hypothetical protein